MNATKLLGSGDFSAGHKSVIGEIESSSRGNLILRIGRQSYSGASWFQTEHVVLSPQEVEELISICGIHAKKYEGNK